MGDLDLVSRQSQLVEKAVDELISTLKDPLTEAEVFKVMQEDNNEQPDVYTVLLNTFTQRNTEAFVRCQ